MNGGSHKETLESSIRGGHPAAQSRLIAPLLYGGSLDSYLHQDLTPAIGREYQGLQIRDILTLTNHEDVIKDLATCISQRGVVFLRGCHAQGDEAAM